MGGEIRERETGISSFTWSWQELDPNSLAWEDTSETHRSVMLTCQHVHPKTPSDPAASRKQAPRGHCVPRSGAAVPGDLRARESQRMDVGQPHVQMQSPRHRATRQGAARQTRGVT